MAHQPVAVMGTISLDSAQEECRSGGERTLVVDVVVDHPAKAIVLDEKVLDEVLVDCVRVVRQSALALK